MYAKNSLYQKCIEKIFLKDYEAFKNKTFFVTGASGLVGSFVVDTLMYLNIQHNYNIKVFATFSSKKSLNERFVSYNDNELFIPVIQDINNPIKCDYSIDYIIHTASNTHPQLYVTKPVETIELNILGTLNILQFAKNNSNCKTLFLSTLEVYGEDKTIESFSENNVGFIDFNTTRACYPESKRLAETLCHSFNQEFNTDTRIARLGYIYGPTVKLNSSKADVQFLNNALNNEPIILKSAGLQKRSYCFVADVVSALLTILLKGENNEAYNIASQNGNIMLRDFAKTLAEVAEVDVSFAEPTEVELKGGSKVMNSTLNAEKLQNLGWKSLFGLRDGVKNTFKIKKEIGC